MNKIKLLFLLPAAVLAAAATAQNVTTPYSMYGYGILGDRATSMQRQMGGVGYAMNSGRQINSDESSLVCGNRFADVPVRSRRRHVYALEQGGVCP